MQAVPRWRNLLILRNSVNFSSTQFASFHSTPICNDKKKKKGMSDSKRGHQPSKNYARYVVREKRADAKSALRSLLFNCEDTGAALKRVIQAEERINGWDTADADGNVNNPTKKNQSKSGARRAHKTHNHRRRRKHRKGSFSDEDEFLDDNYPEDIFPEYVFRAAFGHRSFTWSYHSSWNQSSRNSTWGFEWRKTFDRKYDDQEEQEEASKTYCNYKTFNADSHSDRAILGLPLEGPLRKEDVKNAFRVSALKWHPDRNQGSSQAAAEEKFKQCVDAYKSLCNTL